MTDARLATLLVALDLAAFERRPDGSFALLAPAPPWFARLGADGTFPFLGHILTEVRTFFEHEAPGRADWGPCVEVDPEGREFHYTVAAITTESTAFLVFQLDPGTDRLREVLRKVREDALAGEQSGQGARPETLAAVRREVHVRGEDMHEHLRRLLGTGPTSEQYQIWQTLSASCDALMKRVEELTRS